VRKGDVTNPYKGLPGFWNHWNRFTYRFTGAAQVGVGRGKSEAPYQPPADPNCPLCGRPMSEHRIERGAGRVSTRVHCPQ
jgi:hypothetical protein